MLKLLIANSFQAMSLAGVFISLAAFFGEETKKGDASFYRHIPLLIINCFTVQKLASILV